MVPCLSLNGSKTKELIMDFRKRQQWPYTTLMISGTPGERVSSFKYLGVDISEDLTWTAHIQTQVKKARQRMYHLRQLRKFRVSPAILKTFYSGAIESVLTQCISVWYGNAFKQDCKALQRVVRLAERISGSALPSLQDIYFKCCNDTGQTNKYSKQKDKIDRTCPCFCHKITFYYVWKGQAYSLSPTLGLSLTDTHIVCTHLNKRANVLSITLTILSVTLFKNLKMTWLLTSEVATTALFVKNSCSSSL